MLAICLAMLDQEADRRLFLDIGKQEACGFLFPCIKIDGGKECLKGVG